MSGIGLFNSDESSGTDKPLDKYEIFDRLIDSKNWVAVIQKDLDAATAVYREAYAAVQRTMGANSAEAVVHHKDGQDWLFILLPDIGKVVVSPCKYVAELRLEGE